MPVPDVVWLTPAALTREYYRDAAAPLPADGVDERVLALYAWDDGAHGTVYLLDERGDAGPAVEDPLDDPVVQERLLHELVHHVRHRTDAHARFDSDRRGEKDAYLIGGRFLAARHVTDPLPNRRVLAHPYSRGRSGRGSGLRQARPVR